MGWYGWSVASGDGSRPRSPMTGSNSTCRLLGRGRRGKFAARSGLSRRRNPHSLTTGRRVTPEPVIGPRLARTRWVQPAPRVLPTFFNQTRLMNVQRRSSRSPDTAQLSARLRASATLYGRCAALRSSVLDDATHLGGGFGLLSFAGRGILASLNRERRAAR